MHTNTDRQAGRQTATQAGRQTGRQADIHTYKHIDTNSFWWWWWGRKDLHGHLLTLKPEGGRVGRFKLSCNCFMICKQFCLMAFAKVISSDALKIWWLNNRKTNICSHHSDEDKESSNVIKLILIEYHQRSRKILPNIHSISMNNSALRYFNIAMIMDHLKMMYLQYIFNYL